MCNYGNYNDLKKFTLNVEKHKLAKKIIIFNNNFEKFIENDNNNYSIIHFDIYSYMILDKYISTLISKLKKGGFLLIGGYGALSLPQMSQLILLKSTELKETAKFIVDQNGYGIFIKL